MYTLIPEASIQQARERRERLLAEAERERLYHMIASTQQPKHIELRWVRGVVLTIGELFIAVGSGLKAWAQPKPAKRALA